MKRRPKIRDVRQREMLLPIIGSVPSGGAWSEGSWQRQLLGVIAAAAVTYGKPQVAVWAGCDQRSVENWIAFRNLPALEPTIRLASHLPEFALVLASAMRGDHREVA